MNKPILHIPSVISQSCFVDDENERVELKPTEIDYFYLLLFLYRTELLRQTPNLLLRDGNKYYFNDMVRYGSVDIEMIEFQNYGAVTNYQYDGIKAFIDKLSELSIKTNLLRKNRDREIEKIKIVDSHSWDSTLLTINLTKEFVKLIIHTEKFFMDVDLTNVFALSGGKAKLLYLMLKDYSKSGAKDLRKTELQQLIGTIPQSSLFEGMRDQINEVTDIKCSYSEEGYRKKTYKFKINHKVNLKSAPKGKAKTKKLIDMDVMEKSKQQLQQMKNKGQKIANEEGYLKTIYDNEMQKMKPKEMDKSESDIELEEWIQSTIYELKLEGSIDYRHNNYLVLKAKNAQMDRMEDLFIYDDYKIYNRMDAERKNPITNDSESSMDFINDYVISGDVFCSYGQTISNATVSQIMR